MTLAIDGSVTNTLVSSVTLSTSFANDVIMCYVVSNLQITAISDTAGLSWIKRADSFNTQNSIWFSKWYAISAGILTSNVISPNPAPLTGRITAFGISGANTSVPFDSNGSLPVTTNPNAGDTSVAATFSTSNANDMILVAFRTSSSAGTITRPVGFTQVLATGTAEDHAYLIVSSTQSSVTETYTYTNTLSPIMFLDAIQATAAVGTILPFPWMNTTGNMQDMTGGMSG